MRYKTKTFQLIENYLKTCCDKCFRAHDVYDYIVANEMKVNISPVYRNLEQFVDAGQLIKYKSGNNDVWMYRLNQQFSQCHEHLHLQCKECGKIIVNNVCSHICGSVVPCCTGCNLIFVYDNLLNIDRLYFRHFF